MSKESLEVMPSEGPKFGALMGRHDYALDPKRRLTIPSEWRRLMGDVIYAMPDRKECCINLYPKVEMDVYLDQLRQKALLDQSLNKICAAIGMVSQQLTFDVQGRVRICDRLLQYAGLESTVAMVGSVRMLKLYAPEVIGPEDQIDVASFDAALTEAGL